MVVSYGAAALGPREVAAKDERIGLLRLKNVWPVPVEPISEVASRCDQILVCEMNLGQLYHEIRRIAIEAGCRRIEFLSKIGGEPPTPGEVRHKLREMGVI
jgi:2-oxoglutarate ferredoxin oxidoreductase subunit alpha